MNKFVDYLEKKGSILMTLFIVLQLVIFILFSILFLIVNEEQELELKLFIIGSGVIFIAFMIHFAYHSVILFNIDSESIFYRINIVFDNVHTIELRDDYKFFHTYFTIR